MQPEVSQSASLGLSWPVGGTGAACSCLHPDNSQLKLTQCWNTAGFAVHYRCVAASKSPAGFSAALLGGELGEWKDTREKGLWKITQVQKSIITKVLREGSLFHS